MRWLIFAALLVNPCFTKETTILSFDGGGVRGVISLEILKHLEKQTGLEVYDTFDVYAGTSTGSIIAVFMAAGMSTKTILALYKEISCEVFSDKSYFDYFYPEYNNAALKRIILDQLQQLGYAADATLAELPKKVVIPTVSLKAEQAEMWSLVIQENFTEEGGKVKIIDAILESSAAPTYFPSYKNFVDGGVVMNDPSLAALVTTYQPQMDDLRTFRVFAVGTGYVPQYIEDGEDWGVLQWLINYRRSGSIGASPLLSLIMDVDEQIPSEMCTALLGKAYRKINLPLTESFPLDDYKQIDKMITYTKQFIHEDKVGWQETCEWVEQNLLNQ